MNNRQNRNRLLRLDRADNLIHECEQKGAFVTMLDPHVSTRGEMGHIVLTVLGMVVQMERRFIKKRQRDGIEKAKAEGSDRGGKRRLDHDKILRLDGQGNGPAAIANRNRLGRRSYHRHALKPGSTQAEPILCSRHLGGTLDERTRFSAQAHLRRTRSP